MGVSIGNVVVNDRNLTIKKMFGQTKVIPKVQISNISKTGSIFYGLFICCTIIGIPRGLKMLMGKRLIQVKTTGGSTHEFWLTNQEYKKLQNNL